MLGCGRMEHLVFAGYLEALDAFKAVVGSVGVVEVNLHGVAYNLHLLEGHALAEESLHAIGLAQGLQGKALAHRLLLAWMNLLYLVWINQVFGAHDAAVRNHLGSVKLLLAESWTCIAIHITIMIRCNLHEIEWQLALLEVSAPLGYEVGKALGVLTSRVAHVGTALVEEDSLHAIVEDRMEGSVAPEKRIEEVPLELRILRHLDGVEVFLRVLLQIVTV